MDEKKEKHIDTNVTSLKYKDEFKTVYDIISAHKKRAMRAVHHESIGMLWEVGAYVSDRLKRSAWGMASCGCWQNISTPKAQRLKDGVIVLYIRWCSSMIPIPLRALASWWNSMAYNTTYLKHPQRTSLILCHSKRHKLATI